PTATASPTSTAVGNRSPTDGDPTTITDPGQPGFGILAALAGLGGAALWRAGRGR
ncbi:MAG: PGF-CTERM sorting domain-containing protein, partial [Actinobacteria bacterium]|nr:PGF-CTERM sorting domain-containing protein [Actinomycetota bacterium]NIU70728.1 PGF-CTERM sorting domain-containing protein [Actinomycetota bacterium]NIV90318.1 PGF-CTERM sorting domain-containing protein [Actinomycetota bacterium]NIW32630.1 PGF-CTERM sorting domain-containing protein [Actinomycetota bacterium]NIX24834.1 PGF-CTERM sorting domain-containing protein [Actinomycetota bacterium]